MRRVSMTTRDELVAAIGHRYVEADRAERGLVLDEFTTVTGLRQACKQAAIAPAVSFHILRHTLASRLAQRGAPLGVVAAALGNTEAMAAKHYAHLSPNYVADTIRQAAGEMGLATDSRVVTLRPVATAG